MVVDHRGVPRAGEFPPGTKVRVRWGRKRKRALVPEEVRGVSYYGRGLESHWPAYRGWTHRPSTRSYSLLRLLATDL